MWSKKPALALPTFHDRGVATLELALVAPVLVLLVFATLEASRAVRLSQTISNFAREATVQAFLQCSDRSDPELSTCLSSVTKTVTAGAKRRDIRIAVLISGYHHDPKTKVVTMTTTKGPVSSSTLSRKTTSRFSVGVLSDSRNSTAKLLEEKHSMLITEVVYDFLPALDFGLGLAQIREVAVL